jgi:uncharacterized protein CbrC (UPF0167 family)
MDYTVPLCIAPQPQAAKLEGVHAATVTRVDDGDEVAEHRVEFVPGFDAWMDEWPNGYSVKLWMGPPARFAEEAEKVAYLKRRLEVLREDNDALRAERDAARAVLAHVASIAHQGGLAGYDYHEALADIRALTIKNWNGTGTRADALERLNAAIDAARGRG